MSAIDTVQADPSSPDPRIGACVYLLHGLLQRLDRQQPGLIDEMTEGVRHDCDAIDPAQSAWAAQGREIADEALRILERMSGQLKYARESASNT